MGQVDATASVKIYEKDGEDVRVGDEDAKLMVKSHWNISTFVILRFGKRELTVVGDDLTCAIGKCSR